MTNITETSFIQHAYYAKQRTKPSKTDVGHTLARLAESHPDIMPDLAEMYGHFFMPGKAPAKKAATCKWSWLALAINPKDIRDYLRFIHVKDGVASATDGHRLHQVWVDALDGYYCPRTFVPVHPLDWQSYPDLTKVIPDPKTMESVTLARVQTSARTISRDAMVVDLVAEDTTPHVHRICSVNADYWAHAIAPARGEEGVVYYQEESSDTFQARILVALSAWPSAIAVVMPVRIDDEYGVGDD